MKAYESREIGSNVQKKTTLTDTANQQLLMRTFSLCDKAERGVQLFAMRCAARRKSAVWFDRSTKLRAVRTDRTVLHCTLTLILM